MQIRSLFGFISLAFIIIIIGNYVIVAQSALIGEWSANTKESKPAQIYINFEHRSEKDGRNRHGTTFFYNEIEGLSPEQVQGGNVAFRLVREAGTIECVGTFVNGRGSGTFTFHGSRTYLDDMRSRGFDFSNSSRPAEQLFAAATLNVTTVLADGLLASNFGKLDVDDLFKAAIFKITPEFIAEMKATGFPNLEFDDLVKASIFKIDAAYVQQVRSMGFADGDFEGLVKFRIFKVSPEFLSDLKSEGLTSLSPEDVVQLRIFNIDAEYVKQARAEDPKITVQKLVQKRIGVSRR